MGIGSKKIRGLLVFVFIVIIFGGIYGYYCNKAAETYIQATDAIDHQDWHSAQASLLSMKNIYAYSLPNLQKSTNNYLSITNLFLKLENAIENNNVALAMTTYDDILSTFPATAKEMDIEKEKYDYMLKSAETLHSLDYFGQSMALYTLIAEQYPDSDIVEMMDEGFPQITFDKAISLREKNDFQNTVDLLIALRKENPEFSEKNNVQEEIQTTYLKWAIAAVENNDCDLAFDKYDYIQLAWPNTDTAKQANDNYIPSGVTCANALHTTHNYTKEVEILELLQKKFPESEKAETITEKLIDAYKSYGDQLMNSGEFYSAMMYYETLLETIEDSQVKSAINEKNETIKTILLTDEGPEGQKIINKIRDEFCNNTREFPSIIDDVPSTANKAVVCNRFFYKLPDSQTAHSLSELKFVIGGNENQRNSAVCPYTGDNYLVQIQYYYFMQLYDVVYKTPSKRGTIYGTAAPYCPATHAFQWGYEEEFGEKVTDEQVAKWLDQVLP